MGKVIRSCRKGKGSVFKAHTTGRKGAVALKKLDFAERHGYVKGVVRELLHDPGRGAPIAKIQFKDPYRFKKVMTTVCAPEGMFSGQFVYQGKKGVRVCVLYFMFLYPSARFLIPILHRHTYTHTHTHANDENTNDTHLFFQLRSLLETSCPSRKFPKVPQFATLRPRWAIAERWLAHLVTTPSSSHTMPTRASRVSACPLAARRPSPTRAEP